MKKRIISLLLAVIMIVGMVPFAAIPAMAAEENDWSHTVHYGKYGVLVSFFTGGGIGEGETVNGGGYAMPFNSEADLLYAIATVPSHMDQKSLGIILSKDVTISSLKNDNAYDFGEFNIFLNGHTLTVKGDVDVSCGYLRLFDGTVSLLNNTKTGFTVQQLAVVTNAAFSNCRGRIFDLPNNTSNNHIGRRGVFVSGVTFENCISSENGTCVYINSESGRQGDIDFDNCRFIGCSSSSDGGAVYIDDIGANQQVTFENTYALNCTAAGDGGFMYINDADAKVFGNSSTFISGCTAGDDGGAVYTPKMAQLDGFIFADNHAEDNGGAIYNESTWAAISTISNCRFYRNSSGEEGGAVYVDDDNGKVENCKFFENEGHNAGYSLYSDENSTQINGCTFKSPYDTNAVYGGIQSNCKYPETKDYSLINGDGSQENPYIIENIDDWDTLHYMALKRVRMYPGGTEQVIGDEYCLYGKYFRLDADITVCNTVGEVRDIISLTGYSEFNGIFDGNGHTITYLSLTGSDRNGVFGHANSATVKDLTVNGYMKGGNQVGGIFGSTYNCTAENCTNNMTFYDARDCVGGIAGYSEISNYTYCTNNSKVAGMQQIGGIVGYSNGDTVNGCVNNGDVVGLHRCGGIVGAAHETADRTSGERKTPKIINCINRASVTAYGNYAGGLIGYEESAVEAKNSIVTGKVSAGYDAATHTVHPVAGDYKIYTKLDESMCLSIESNSYTEVKPLELYKDQYSGSNVFTLIYDSQYDFYYIKPKNAELYLGPDGVYNADSSFVRQRDKNYHQFLANAGWTFELSEDGEYFYIRNEMPQHTEDFHGYWYMNVPGASADMGKDIIVYRFTGEDNEKFRLVKQDGGDTLSQSDGSDAISGWSAQGSTYDNLYYNKEKVFAESKYGTGLSTNALNRVSPDTIGGEKYIMPDSLNDVVIENKSGTEEYMPVYFSENNILNFAHSIDENNLTLGEKGKTIIYCATKKDTVLSNRITIKGNVLLYLKNNSELKAEHGITVESDNTLNIYGSTDAESGKLIANGLNGDAAIGGVHGSDGRDYQTGNPGTPCGNLNMYGGIVTVFGSGDGVGFGGGFGGHGGLRGNGGNGGDGGILNLYGGQFTVSGSERAIGGGKGGYGDDSMITTNPSWPGESTTINIYGTPEIKAGENAGTAQIVDKYNDEKYFSVVYTPGDSGNLFPFIPNDSDDPLPFNPDSGEHTHFGILRHGMAATKSSAGYKDYYECSCGGIFEDEACTVLIEDLEAWKAEGGNGYIPPLKAEHDISYEGDEHVIFVKDLTESAGEGETVTFTFTIRPRYIVDTVTVKTADGDKVQVKSYNGIYSFVMPDEDVTVKVTSERKIISSEIVIEDDSNTNEGETNPETGAPVLNMSTGITVIAAAAFIFTDKKHK